MMNCEKFKRWLIDHHHFDSRGTSAAREHMKRCESCQKLHDIDQSVEVIIKDGLRPVAPRPGLVARARRRVESPTGKQPLKFLVLSWRTITPALATALLLLFLVLNPFTGKLSSIEDLVAHSVANHLNTEIAMEFRSLNLTNAGFWFSERLGFDVKLPDMARLGLTFLGGRKCSLGQIRAAYLYCNSKGKRASLFLINPDDIRFDISDNRKYVIKDSGYTVTIWKEAGVICALAV